MFGKIKTYAIAALAVLTGILAALWQHSRASHARAELKGQRVAREVENKATDAMINGLEKENEIKNDNSTDRDNFLN